jgi:RimJ/RimL family protein N-acetyltransferase
VQAAIKPENTPMIGLAKKLGFAIVRDIGRLLIA